MQLYAVSAIRQIDCVLNRLQSELFDTFCTRDSAITKIIIIIIVIIIIIKKKDEERAACNVRIPEDSEA